MERSQIIYFTHNNQSDGGPIFQWSEILIAIQRDSMLDFRSAPHQWINRAFSIKSTVIKKNKPCPSVESGMLVYLEMTSGYGLDPCMSGSHCLWPTSTGGHA